MYQHCLMMPYPEGCPYRHSSASGLVQVIAKMRSVSVQCVSRCKFLLFFPLCSPVMRGPTCQSRPLLQQVALSFAPVSSHTTISDKCLCFSVLVNTALARLIHTLSPIILQKSGIPAQLNAFPANLQLCCSTENRDLHRSKISTFFSLYGLSLY